MKKKILVLATVLALVAVLAVPMAVFAGNAGEQQASTSSATTISIKAQNYTSDVSTIVFPQGAIGDNVSTPYNNIDTASNPQTFGGAGTAKPVVTLLNGGAVVYTIYYNITAWSPSGVVASEYYLVNGKGLACANADAVNQAVTFGADTSTTVTITNGAGNEKDLYLKVTLGTTAGMAATSTLTILGES